MKIITLLAAPLFIAMFTVGCGSDTTSGGNGGGSGTASTGSSKSTGSGSGSGYACEVTTAGTTVCSQVNGYTSAETDAAKKACTMQGGKESDSCPTANLLGCCETTTKAGTTSYDTFACYYKSAGLTVDTVKMTCSASMGKFTPSP